MTARIASAPRDIVRPTLSPVIRAASDASMAAQRTVLRATRLELGFVMLAALGGALAAVAPKGPGGATAVLGFLGAVISSGYMARVRPERQWYDGRAVSESFKTLAWRYTVGGKPFAIEGIDPREIDEAFDRSLREVAAALSFAAVGSGPAITEDMRGLRASSLPDRRTAYEMGRIADQQDRYALKATHNEERPRRWKQIIFGLELIGLVVGIGIVASAYTFDAIGVIAAAAAAATAWLQLKQHESLSRAYSVASAELSSIRSLIRHQTNEKAWSEFVDQSEEAISREHTLWRASRGVTTPTGLPERGGRSS